MPKIIEVSDIGLGLNSEKPDLCPENPADNGNGMDIGQIDIGVQPTIDISGLPETVEQLSPQDIMFNYLGNSATAFFKSQQTDEPELDFKQKRQIAYDILTKSPGKFLARFGKHLQPAHLDIFTEMMKNTEDYELAFQVKQLSRYHCEKKRQLDVRNRRFEALKKLIAEGLYFDELEMKKRNPLLYEDFIGKYLTQKEIEEQDKHSSGAENATLVDILLNQIEKDQIKELQKSQLEAEEEAREEVDTSDEDSEGGCAGREGVHIGDQRMDSDNDSDGSQEDAKERPEGRKTLNLSSGEKSFWKGEFFSRMYDSFLEGKDVDFDYSQVDDNPEYDNVTDRAQDEEEKYFDSETPNTFVASAVNSDTEDELDIFMKNLKPDPSPLELSEQLDKM